MSQSHYSLRWNNHQTHLLSAFANLLQAETLVDVTLVCENTRIKAHKVVLSACSSYFQKILTENPCKHPVVVLKDFNIRDVTAVIEFIYKGEVSVMQEQLENLIKVAELLEVKGLTQTDPYVVDRCGEMSSVNQTSTPSTSPNDFDRSYYGKHPSSGVRERASPASPPVCDEPAPKLPHMYGISFCDSLMPRSGCHSPIPRRKQARPRRVSGETPASQDAPKQPSPPPPTPPCDDPAPENLCVRKPQPKDDDKARLPPSPELDLTRSAGGGVKEYRRSPPVPMPPALSMKQEIDSHSPVPYPPPPSMSALAMSSPHGKYFGLESHLGLFPPGLENCRTPLFDIGDIRTPPDPQLFVKKKMGRPKGQHSAPRGGPPRSWTNAELTEALQHVWNKKMTTSQASRIFGIPYNSLLMYVRGKYGKSLKLEQLRKDCIGGPPAPVDLLAMNNNTVKGGGGGERDGEPPQPNTRPSSTEEPHPPPAPVFNPFGGGFFPDFGAGFPIPVSMIHLLPPSDKSRDHYAADDVKKEVDEEDMFRPPPLSVDDRRELVQQNGQD